MDGLSVFHSLRHANTNGGIPEASATGVPAVSHLAIGECRYLDASLPAKNGQLIVAASIALGFTRVGTPSAAVFLAVPSAMAALGQDRRRP